MTRVEELLQAHRTAGELPQALADFQALAVAEMRALPTPVKDIAHLLGVSRGRVYQILDEAAAVQADSRRLLRVGAVAKLVQSESQPPRLWRASDRVRESSEVARRSA